MLNQVRFCHFASSASEGAQTHTQINRKVSFSVRSKGKTSANDSPGMEEKAGKHHFWVESGYLLEQSEPRKVKIAFPIA